MFHVKHLLNIIYYYTIYLLDNFLYNKWLLLIHYKMKKVVNFVNLIIECIMVIILLSVSIWYRTKDDRRKLKSFYYYPEKVQYRIKSIESYKYCIPEKSVKKIYLIISFIAFLIIFIIASIINETLSFWHAFRNSVIIGVVGNLYQLIFIHFLWFSRSKRARISGTEDMENEYRNPKVYIHIFLKSMAITFAAGFLTGVFIRLYILYIDKIMELLINCFNL